MITDQLSRLSLYEGLSPHLPAVISWLLKTDLGSLTDGRIDIDHDNSYALVQSYTTKLAEQGRWETHRRYIDVQVIINGVEQIGYTPIEQCRIEMPHNVEKDIAFHTGTGGFIRLHAGMAMILLPHDAHMPMIAAGQPSLVRKVVVKVAVS